MCAPNRSARQYIRGRTKVRSQRTRTAEPGCATPEQYGTECCLKEGERREFAMSDRNRSEDSLPQTTDRLRADIDSGRTGDKVGFSDPATAPLGTDDEAAGTPPSKAAIAEAARQEVSTRPHGHRVRPDH